MRRREFIRLFTSTAVAWPVTARAQQAAMPVIGLLGSATASDWTPFVSAFRHGLRDAGYVEGDNVTIEPRWANNQYEQLPRLAAELVQRQVTVIFERMSAAAKSLGAELIAHEQTLDQLFVKGEIRLDRLTAETAAIAKLQGRLRLVHLGAHLETRALLNPDQIARYEELRGYGQPEAPAQHHHHNG